MAATSLGSGGKPASQSFVAYEISMNFTFASWLGISAISNPSRLADMQIDKVGRYFRSFSSARSLPARQLGNLNEVSAGVVQLGDGRARDLGWRHGELAATRFDALAIALDVIGKKHGRGLGLLEYGLLVDPGRRVVVERELQLGSVRVLG